MLAGVVVDTLLERRREAGTAAVEARADDPIDATGRTTMTV
jgi:hypothetical protein